MTRKREINFEPESKTVKINNEILKRIIELVSEADSLYSCSDIKKLIELEYSITISKSIIIDKIKDNDFVYKKGVVNNVNKNTPDNIIIRQACAS